MAFLFFMMVRAATQGVSVKGDRDMMMKIGTVRISFSIKAQEAESINWPSSMMKIILSSFTVCSKIFRNKVSSCFCFFKVVILETSREIGNWTWKRSLRRQ